MSGPFDAVVKILIEADEEATILGLEEEIASIDAVLVLLEAAGKVDKKSWEYIIGNLDSCSPSIEELDQMEVLLAALPDSPKPVKQGG